MIIHIPTRSLWQ